MMQSFITDPFIFISKQFTKLIHLEISLVSNSLVLKLFTAVPAIKFGWLFLCQNRKVLFFAEFFSCVARVVI